MMWQDLIFMIGSGLSIFFLAPTLRDASARVPLGTSLPSMAIGLVYGVTFATMGMSFSALGAVAAGSMWALIALFRSPRTASPTISRPDKLLLFARDCRRWVSAVTTGHDPVQQFVTEETAIEYDAVTTRAHPPSARLGTNNPADD